ncbi:hypothetical protein CDL12_18393 [Handroanthus impetiginosus]|uniref:Oligopeptide transporter n=1 Tax=Handroanthus impetiginosus TaxID=429701 RepID=A0A2G9GUZ5_9LAMI|nr:hypothetical protein CDL12_18393 [Handroanthus impetiginosus]
MSKASVTKISITVAIFTYSESLVTNRSLSVTIIPTGDDTMTNYASSKAKKDIHTKLMKSYKEVPSWWFYFLLAMTMVVSVSLCIFLKKEIQMPFWAFLLVTALAFSFTLPISIITATTNQTPGLNVITEYIMGVIYPGRPIANVCFKVYGYISMTRAIAFLGDFKLGHYMKIPPRSIFLVQLVGAMIASTAFSKYSWIPLIDLPVILGVAGNMPYVSGLSYNSWIFVGTIFNFFVFRYKKKWWQRYNYVLSAALEAGVAFMVVFLYFTVGIENTTITWWGNNGSEHSEHRDLASCPTAKGVTVDRCLYFSVR